jgi:hypothetical protein
MWVTRNEKNQIVLYDKTPDNKDSTAKIFLESWVFPKLKVGEKLIVTSEQIKSMIKTNDPGGKKCS